MWIEREMKIVAWITFLFIADIIGNTFKQIYRQRKLL